MERRSERPDRRALTVGEWAEGAHARLRSRLGPELWEERVDEAFQRAQVLAEHLCCTPKAELSLPVTGETLSLWRKRYSVLGIEGLVDLRAGPKKTRTPDAAASVPPLLRRPIGSRFQLLKWPGSKSATRNFLASLCPRSFSRYLEPFAGSAALFYTLEPKRAELSDINDELMNTFRVVRDTPAELLAELATHHNSERHFYAVRAILPATLPPVEAAARTLFLNRTCFNGLYRVNARGHFNVPYGRQENTTFYRPDTVWDWHRRLQGVGLHTRDFNVRDVRRGDFVFLDPPYSRGMNGGDLMEYAANVFGDAEQERLACFIEEIDMRGARFMLTVADTADVRRRYRRFTRTQFGTHRKVGGHVNRRGVDHELVIRNYC